MIQRPSIPHLKAMVVDNNILEGQGRGSLKRLPCPFFLKSTLFTNSGRGKPLIMPRPSSSRIKMSIIRAFKWGIICFCTIIGSLLIWRKPKLVFEVYHSNRSPLYVDNYEIGKLKLCYTNGFRDTNLFLFAKSSISCLPHSRKEPRVHIVKNE